MHIRLTAPQHALVASTAQFPALVGGYGSGKSHALTIRAIVKKLLYPAQSIAYYMPTFDLCRLIAFPRFAEQLTQLGLRFQLNKSYATIDIAHGGQIIFRTFDSPERIIGFEAADSFADELDTLPIAKATDVWNKIIARNREKKPDGSINTVAVGTSPEGFRFVYERWKKNPAPGYELIKASTYSNARNLPVGYIDSLRNTYPTNLLAAYLDGQFVNLTAGSVYADFNRELNGSRETIRPRETLHVGMDFNVTKMASAIHVLRDGEPHAVDELVNVFDTPAMIQSLIARFRPPDKPAEEHHPIMVYPDASGKSRKSVNASESDLALLRQARFSVCVNQSNPAVKDRVLAANALILKDGKRRYRVNEDACPHLVEALEKQAYDKNGEPDKSTGLDHIIDAATYFLAYKWPIKRPVMSINLGRAN